MRWAFEGVDFEPGGVDHASPGSSYTVGKELVKIYDGRAPSFVGYSFVGAGGQVKMSSSRGGVPTAADALQILEAPILRWLYVRRAPKQAFNVDFGAEVVRLYDEWDALGKQGRRPVAPRRPGARLRASLLDRGGGPAADALGRGALPAALLGRRRDRRERGAGQPDHRRRRPRARFGRRPRAAPRQGDDVDLGVRARRGAHHRARLAGHRAASRRSTRTRSSGCASSSTGCRDELDLSLDDRADLRRTQAGPRPRARGRADRPGQGRPEELLPAALQPAGRRRPRTSPADAVPGAGADTVRALLTPPA